MLCTVSYCKEAELDSGNEGQEAGLVWVARGHDPRPVDGCDVQPWEKAQHHEVKVSPGQEGPWVRQVQPQIHHQDHEVSSLSDGLGLLLQAWLQEQPWLPRERGGQDCSALHTHYGQKLVPKFRARMCRHNQQDSAPCLTAKICKQFFKQEWVTLLDWPGNSPDLTW